MTAELRRSLGLAGIGLLGGFLLVVGLFGAGEFMKRATEPARAPQTDARPPVAALETPAGGGTAGEPDAPSEASGKVRAGSAGAAPDAKPLANLSPDAMPGIAPETMGEPRKPAAAGPESGPSFDLIRVEPDGEAVVAGRGLPNTSVEMLVNGKIVARALADPNGQFAIVPPALPPGNSEIVLRSTGPEGRETRSKQSVAVVVAPTRDTKPLVALTSPDQPTVVLSQPEAKNEVAEARPGAERAPAGAPRGDSRAAEARAKTEAQGANPVKIVSVDAQENGRLFITSRATPGSTVRLYLNDTLVAPGSVGHDGTVTFTIGRGVRPGDYKIRIDQVDTVTGKVRARSEVAFNYPVPARVASREPEAAGLPAPASRPAAEPPGPTTAVEPKPPSATASGPHTSAPSGPRERAQAQAGPHVHAGPQPHVRAEATPRAEAAPGAAAPEDRPAVAAAPAQGAVQMSAQVETPAARSEGTQGVFVAEISTARITRGDSLWQISRRTYGKGDRYTVIYDANQQQIRDPDLIYPGQIFVLPTDDGAAQRQKKRG
ncbi:LysM peptidoglycan-binding domain-containing protein [Methylobacterium durans]|uniref:LysM peptidoglycan-binding domain-containing protein n=1 Tax=Methylobacterium durans TaxID=2202825 RepID=UPI002AFEBC01|nr:LysM peptidoglycan-binding domain-containing protein [Methylobacterium durans]MEA1832496.1 LysM peptidoglycan-binding domain-containing protein [Methylobacterium durans]